MIDFHSFLGKTQLFEKLQGLHEVAHDHIWFLVIICSVPLNKLHQEKRKNEKKHIKYSTKNIKAKNYKIFYK